MSAGKLAPTSAVAALYADHRALLTTIAHRLERAPAVKRRLAAYALRFAFPAAASGMALWTPVGYALECFERTPHDTQST